MADEKQTRVSLEDYLNRKPLTPELEALARGEEEELDDSPAIPATSFYRPDAQFELTMDDREHLRRLSFEPGYPVLFRLIDKFIAARETNAKSESEQDPLGNRDRIANLWAYFALAKRFRNEIAAQVDAELKVLQDAQTKAKKEDK